MLRASEGERHTRPERDGPQGWGGGLLRGGEDGGWWAVADAAAIHRSITHGTTVVLACTRDLVESERVGDGNRRPDPNVCVAGGAGIQTTPCEELTTGLESIEPSVPLQCRKDGGKPVLANDGNGNLGGGWGGGVTDSAGVVVAPARDGPERGPAADDIAVRGQLHEAKARLDQNGGCVNAVRQAAETSGGTERLSPAVHIARPVGPQVNSRQVGITWAKCKPPATGCGTEELTVSPSPSRPRTPRPQQNPALSTVTAHTV